MNKKAMSETDIRSKFITPALIKAGWDLQKQIREEVTFTAGRIIVRKKLVTRGPKKRADYILQYKRIVEKLEQLMVLCDELEEKIEESKREAEKLMQAVLQEAFKGTNNIYPLT